MSNSYFQFKQFTIHQDKCAMKVTTDACLFGAWVAEEVRSRKSGVGSLLDIGTGTGLLSLMLLQKNQKAFIDAIEIDNEVAEQAMENVNASPWNSRINIIEADVRSFSFQHKYDVIVSNPPFYEKEIRSENEKKNIAHHSDQLVLDELLSIIKENLSPTGNFFLLLPYKRNEEIKKLFRDHQLAISKILFIRQSPKHDYFRIIIKGKPGTQEKEETGFNEMPVWNDQQQYTPEFVELLKDYYLYL